MDEEGQFDVQEIQSERRDGGGLRMHVHRRDSEYLGGIDAGAGRPKRRFMDGVSEDMKLVGGREEDAGERGRQVIG